MSIRDIARELYRLQKEVDALERELAAAGRDEQETLRQRLRKTKAETHRMKRILDGRIDR